MGGKQASKGVRKYWPCRASSFIKSRVVKRWAGRGQREGNKQGRGVVSTGPVWAWSWAMGLRVEDLVVFAFGERRRRRAWPKAWSWAQGPGPWAF